MAKRCARCAAGLRSTEDNTAGTTWWYSCGRLVAKGKGRNRSYVKESEACLLRTIAKKDRQIAKLRRAIFISGGA